MDIGTFFVQRAIVHRVPQARVSEKDEVLPELADVETDLDMTRKAYFQRRIRRSLQNAFESERDTAEASPIPGLVVEFFDDKDDRFVEISQEMARHLHQSQGGSSSAGLLAVVEGTIGTGDKPGKCLVVMKLEIEQGVHFEHVEIDGKRTFTMALEDITLTDSTRVFKASLFPRPGDGGVMGLVSDDQLDSSTTGREVAEYFLKRFLGCRLRETAPIATKRFVESAISFVNTLEDDEKKVRYEAAIFSELNSNEPNVNPEELATKHLDVEDRDNFVARFREDDGRVRLIPKDIELVRSTVRRSWVELDNGVRVSGPPDAVQLAVQAIREATDEKGHRLVSAGIKKVR
jgi:hypothetical protein